MTVRVLWSDDAEATLAVAGDFLAADPARHNLVLTILLARAGQRDGDRSWVVDPDRPLGVAVQTPGRPLTLTAMSATAAMALADALADGDLTLTSVAGEAAAAAAFVGRWTERRSCAAAVDLAQRLYELDVLEPPVGVPGHLRPATDADRPLLTDWVRAFVHETGAAGAEAEQVVIQPVETADFSVWEVEGTPRAIAALAGTAAGVSRVRAVFTPVDQRGRGYAGACVAALSQVALDRGDRCVLYTDLGNATSNALYRRLGYRAIAEGLRYVFV